MFTNIAESVYLFLYQSNKFSKENQLPHLPRLTLEIADFEISKEKVNISLSKPKWSHLSFPVRTIKTTP